MGTNTEPSSDGIQALIHCDEERGELRIVVADPRRFRMAIATALAVLQLAMRRSRRRGRDRDVTDAASLLTALRNASIHL